MRVAASLLIVLGLASACAGTGPDDAADRVAGDGVAGDRVAGDRVAGDSAVGGGMAGDGAAGDGAAEQASKRVGTAVPDRPWAPLDGASVGTLAPTRLPERARAAALASPVPVLLPADRALLDTAHVTTGDGWYTAWLTGPGYHVGVFGTGRPMGVAGPAPAEGLVIDEHRPLVTVSEGVPSISFVRSGVAYRLDLECAAGPSAPMCATVEPLLALYDSLAMLGASSPADTVGVVP